MVLYAYFIPMTDERTNGLDYVDLLLNLERYTGYKGPSPRRIWRAIYEENCSSGSLLSFVFLVVV